MRVLSFIPAFLLAAASFVVAAPTATPSVPATPSAPVPSCAPSVPSSGGSGSSDNSSLQAYIDILTKATTQIQPLSDQLCTSIVGVVRCYSDNPAASCKEGTPDVDTVSGICVQITAVVTDTVTQLKATAQVDLTGLDLTSVCSAIYALLAVSTFMKLLIYTAEWC